MIKLFSRHNQDEERCKKMLDIWSERLYLNAIKYFIENCNSPHWKLYIQGMIDDKCKSIDIVFSINIIIKINPEWSANK